MLKKIATGGIVGLMTGFLLVVGVGMADELPGSVSQEELLSEISKLRVELAEAKESAARSQEVALETRLEAAKFKEEVLARLGVWRARIAEGVMMAIEAKEMASRVEIGEKLQKKIGDLEADISLAKEMAATAKIRADQSSEETKEAKEIAEKARMKTELLLTTVNELVEKVEDLEERLAAKPAPRLVPRNLYKVKKGDSLWYISGYRNIYNDPYQWRKIYQANRDKIVDPDLIYPGQRLVIPPKKFHQVIKNENLWSISNYESIYNDPYQWRKIYQANRDKIVDPGLIYPGQRLVIPQD